MAEFETKCPHCGATLQAQDELIGMDVECPACQKTFKISPPNPDEGKSTPPPFPGVPAAAIHIRPIAGHSDPPPSPGVSEKPDTPPAPGVTAGNDPGEKTFIFVCPDCGTQAELPIILKGKEYECKVCCETTIAEPATEKKCPHCGAVIKFNATRCKYCKKDVNDSALGKIMGKSKQIADSSVALIKEKISYFFSVEKI